MTAPADATFIVTVIPGQIRVSAVLAEGTTRDDAAAIAALFPKSLKVMSTTHRNMNGSESGMVGLTVNTKANGVIGETNETGNKRFESFLKHAARQGFAVETR